MEPRVSPDHTKGGLTPLLQLSKKPKFPVSIQQEAWHPFSNLIGKWSSSLRAEGWLPCWNLIGSPRPLSQLERKPDSCHNQKWVYISLQWLKGIMRWPSELERRPDLPEATCQAPRRPHPNSRGAQLWLPTTTRGTSWDPTPECEMCPNSPAVTREEPSVPPCNSKGALTSLRHHERLPWGTRGSSTGTPNFWWQLEKPRDPPLQARLESFSPEAAPSQNWKGCSIPFSNLRGSPRYPSPPRFPTTDQEKPHVYCLVLTEGQFLGFILWRILMLPSYHKRKLNSAIETLEEPRGSCCKSKGQRVPPQLELRPDSPTPTRMEPRVCLHNPNGGLTPLVYL